MHDCFALPTFQDIPGHLPPSSPAPSPPDFDTDDGGEEDAEDYEEPEEEYEYPDQMNSALPISASNI